MNNSLWFGGAEVFSFLTFANRFTKSEAFCLPQMTYLMVVGQEFTIGQKLSGLLDRIKAGEQVWQEGEDLRDILRQAALDDEKDMPKKYGEPADYGEYLRTDHWKQKRKQALDRAGHRCQFCNAVGTLQVHHRVYNLWHEELSDLTVLCGLCHESFHKERGLAK